MKAIAYTAAVLLGVLMAVGLVVSTPALLLVHACARLREALGFAP